MLELLDGRTLYESNAILWYLASETAFLPTDAYEQADVCRWLLYEQTDVMPMIGGLRFRLVTGRFAPDCEEALRRLKGAHEALSILDKHLEDQAFLAAGRYTIADIATYAYSHLPGDVGIDVEAYPSFRQWLDLVEAQPRFMDDVEPYPPNASVLAGKSIYG